MNTAIATPHNTGRFSRAQWFAPTGPILLSLIPAVQGAFRLSELTGGSEITLENARFFTAPIPAVTHIVSGTVFALLGAFQFTPSLRGRTAWHRSAGRVLIPAGLLAALSGLWMALFYALPESDGEHPPWSSRNPPTKLRLPQPVAGQGIRDWRRSRYASFRARPCCPN